MQIRSAVSTTRLHSELYSWQMGCEIHIERLLQAGTRHLGSQRKMGDQMKKVWEITGLLVYSYCVVKTVELTVDLALWGYDSFKKRKASK